MPKKTVKNLTSEVQELRAQLEEAKETLNAIRRGEIDGLVVSTPKGEQIYTLSGAETPYRLLMEEMKEGALMLSDDNTILYANKGFANIVKQPLVEIVGKNIETIVAPTHLSTLKEILNLSRAKKDVVENEIALKAKDNSLVPVHVSVALLTKNDPKTTLLIATDLTQHMEEQIKKYTKNLEQEITERKKAEKALKESESKFKALSENAPDAIMRFDKNLRILYLNPQDLAAIGKPLEELVGKTNEEIGMPAELCKLWNDTFYRAKTSRKAQEVEFDFNTLIGLKTFNLRIVPEFSETGSLHSYIGISRDISDRKKAEEKLEEYQKNLEKLVEERTKQLKDSERLAAIGVTAGMVGHDIRNPLQAIIGDVYLAKSELAGLPDGEEKRAILESLIETETNIDYINKIVQDLQDYARPLNPNPGEADIKLIIEKLLQKNGIPKNVKVSVEVGDKSRKFVADADYLNRILYNLVTNAVQAMPRGGTLTIRVYKEANDTILVVRDTGVGIPKEIQGKMFTPMFTTKSKGQGFGLPVVKRMTESLGGTVTFESEEGKGTTFTVRLPPPQKR
jgi:PAS domain S-box-containing protein